MQVSFLGVLAFLIHLGNKIFAKNSGIDQDEVISATQNEVNPILNKVFGVALNDISHVTGWDLRLIDDLSLNIGEYQSFYDGSEFSGWSIMALPTQRKPHQKPVFAK